MAEQNGVAMTLGTEISADGLFMAHGTGQSLNQMSETDFKGINNTLKQYLDLLGFIQMERPTMNTMKFQ